MGVGETVLLLSASNIGTGWCVAVLQEYDILVWYWMQECRQEVLMWPAESKSLE